MQHTMEAPRGLVAPVPVTTAAHNGTDNGCSLALETFHYMQDKVQRIVKREIVPDTFADIGRVDSWKTMVRAHAFEELLRVLKPGQSFTVQCIQVEHWEPAPNGNGRQLVIGCELHYKIERR